MGVVHIRLVFPVSLIETIPNKTIVSADNYSLRLPSHAILGYVKLTIKKKADGLGIWLKT